MQVLSQLPGPASFWKHFNFLLETPRESRKCTQISQLIAQKGRDWGYETIVDPHGNVLIRKPASAGFEGRPWVCIQRSLSRFFFISRFHSLLQTNVLFFDMRSHMDMVCEKEATSNHDFAKDPIVPRIVDDKLMATGTTLGADNGVGVALGLMVLEDRTLRHGPLEVLFTVDEEIGLVGAMQMPAGMLRSRRLINIDSEEDWRICIGCAGGFDATMTMPLATCPEGRMPFEVLVSLSGLQGGHSGCEIHKGQANAIQLLGRILLHTLDGTTLGYRPMGPATPAHPAAAFQLLGLCGGTKRNAIPVACTARLALPADPAAREAVLVALRASYEAVAAEFASLEPTMHLRVAHMGAAPDAAFALLVAPRKGAANMAPISPVAALPAPLSAEAALRYLRAMAVVPHGVLRMSPDVAGLVETSINWAKASLPAAGSPHETAAQFEFLARSSCNSQQGLVYDQLAALSNLLGARLSEPINWHNGWLPNPQSALLTTAKRIYAEVTHKEYEVYAIHAGLECGVIGEKYEGMDSISVGPTVKDVHTPKEALYYRSLPGFCTYLLRLLEELQ
ncbi:aminoacyl-histidine dipeptidase [Paratrimastix pyriformis]|uniref:Aminoacyl-histidine dipeptidase n=1 Tax=Paratrimastix pyriformis TaxID=342808 RepID=A0ABQ8UM35_9EUKA|nr:aminoacyl-histidine dipeptidase [Paratrimastix pyriformis]